MVNKENYGLSIFFSLFFIAYAVIMHDNDFLDPLIIALFIILIVSTIFKIKKYCNRIVYNIIVITTLAAMLISEYYLIPNNIVFYILLLINAIGVFIAAYSLLIPEHRQNRKERIIMWIGLSIWLITFFTVTGLFYNNLTIAFILGALTSVLVGISLLIRRRINKTPNEYKPSLYENYKKKQLMKKGHNLILLCNYQEALESFNEVLKMDPNYEPALEGREEVLKLIEN